MFWLLNFASCHPIYNFFSLSLPLFFFVSCHPLSSYHPNSFYLSSHLFFSFFCHPLPLNLWSTLFLSLSLQFSLPASGVTCLGRKPFFFFFFSSFPECKWLPTYPAEREGLICSFVGMRSFQMTCQLSLIVGCLKKAESFGREKLKFSLIFG